MENKAMNTLPKTGGEHKFLTDMYGNEVTLHEMRKGQEIIQVYAKEIEAMMLNGFQLTIGTQPRRVTIVS